MISDNSFDCNSVPEAAKEYVARGWNPVPVAYRDKKPSSGPGWRNVKIRAEDIPRHFNGAPQNIGVQFGPNSNGLTDVDLDCPEALALAPYVLPPTVTIFGRETAPNSHWEYTTDLSKIVDRAALAFDDPRRDGDEARLLELRIGGGGKGAQSVFPPSIHKGTGELISWSSYGEPAKLDGKSLLRKVRLLAACCLLARYWPSTGSGCHDTALVVGGFLARARFSEDDVRHLVAGIAQVANPARAEDDLTRSAEDAARTFHAGGDRTYGYPMLAKMFGDEVAKQIAEWLDYARAHSSTATTPNADDWSEPKEIPNARLPVPPFNPEMLPTKLQRWGQEVAEQKQCPLDFPAVGSMVTFSSVLGCRVCIRPKMNARGWEETANLWGLVVGKPGILKSPALRESLKWLYRADGAAAEKYNASMQNTRLI
jgi:hypothetical protein